MGQKLGVVSSLDSYWLVLANVDSLIVADSHEPSAINCPVAAIGGRTDPTAFLIHVSIGELCRQSAPIINAQVDEFIRWCRRSI